MLKHAEKERGRGWNQVMDVKGNSYRKKTKIKMPWNFPTIFTLSVSTRICCGWCFFCNWISSGIYWFRLLQQYWFRHIGGVFLSLAQTWYARFDWQSRLKIAHSDHMTSEFVFNFDNKRLSFAIARKPTESLHSLSLQSVQFSKNPLLIRDHNSYVSTDMLVISLLWNDKKGKNTCYATEPIIHFYIWRFSLKSINSV